MSDLTAGARIGDYRVTGVVGRGGMGVVYSAERDGERGTYALKVMLPEMSEREDLRRRFLREARYAAAVRHENVVPVSDSGEADGLLYVAMPYIRCLTLRELLIDRGAIAPDRALAVLEQMAAALDAVHEQGLLHRDVKPENVLIASESMALGIGHCYLSDFGLSKSPSQDSVALTAQNQFVGTQGYVSPEQIRSGDIDRRADVYSLACLAFECLCGLQPFRAETMTEVLEAHLTAPRPRISERLPGAPEELDAVLARAMALSPGDRHDTASEFVAELRAALALMPEPAAPAAPVIGRLLLSVTEGAGAGSEILVSDELVIGRDVDGDGRLSGDAQLSRRHARLARTPTGGWTVEDLGSTNGTLVNGEPLSGPRPLMSDDRIELGSTTLHATAAPVEALESRIVEVATPSPAPAATPRPEQPPEPVRSVSLAFVVDPAGALVTVHRDGDEQPAAFTLEDGRWRPLLAD